MHTVPGYDAIRADFARKCKNLNKMVAQVLRGSEVAKIDVRFHGRHINAVSFQKVMHLVESGQIMVIYLPLLKEGENITRQDLDVTALYFDVANDLYKKSTIIHEAVHIRSDMRGKKMIHMEDELLSWIVQAAYLRAGGYQANNWPGAFDKRALPAAFAIFDTLHAGKRVTHAQEFELSSALRALSGDYNRDADKLNLIDGVRPLRH
ncbi:hypothetical protein P0D75_38705 [Paraburkholderia sediminicola]|uniref:hypothetical protein n=1 Tax=Paraburkholderia sediminicola TaxID=458836 RepID=UPI0038B72299